jgi:hypothetical protein
MRFRCLKRKLVNVEQKLVGIMASAQRRCRKLHQLLASHAMSQARCLA